MTEPSAVGGAPAAAIAPKTYYDVLDGLRGLAALVILVYHYMEMIWFDDYVSNPLGHGYLAVDFFFCLSGFVIAFAYDGRMATISKGRFFVNRLIRLHPMVVVGSVIGLAAYVLDPFVGNPLEAGWGRALLALLFSVLLIPSAFMPHRGGGIFPYNTPAWSLFFEYIANIVYAYVLCRLKKIPLLIVGLLCAVWLGWCARSSGWLINGWAIEGITDGFARVFFSFTAGMIVYRFKWFRTNRFGIWLPGLLLLGVFFCPHHDNDWLRETLLVTLVFPLIISLGAGARATGGVRRFALFIGKLSYPLYLSHIWVVWLFTSYLFRDEPSAATLWWLVPTLIAFNLILAWALMKYVDEPLRRWLTSRQRSLK